MLADGSMMSTSMNNRCFCFWIIFTRDFWPLDIFFDLPSPYWCWEMLLGLRCKSLWTIDIFSSIIFYPWFLAIGFFYFVPLPSLLMLRDVVPWWVPGVSLCVKNSVISRLFFYPRYCGILEFFLVHSVCFYLLNVEGCCWLMGARCEPLLTRDVWYLGYFLPMILRDAFRGSTSSSRSHGPISSMGFIYFAWPDDLAIHHVLTLRGATPAATAVVMTSPMDSCLISLFGRVYSGSCRIYVFHQSCKWHTWELQRITCEATSS
jgi:hypothetical protein